MILEDVAGWQYPALGDICDVRDGTHDSPKYVEDGFPLITSKNLTEDGLCFEKVSYISQEDHDAIEKRSAVSDGDILYGMIGTVGNPVIVKKDRDFSVKNVAIFKFLEESLIFNKYLFYVLSSDFVGRQISKESKGGTQKFVSLKVLRGLKIPLPPLETQKQIAAVLEKADQLRKDCQQMEQELNSLAQSVFIDMFGDPVTNPKGWDVGIIGEMLSSANYGTSEKSSTEKKKFPVLRMNNITYEGNWDFSALKYMDMSKEDENKYLVKSGDILFNRTNSKELVGKTAVYREATSMAYAGYLVRARCNELAHPDYISSFMNSKYGKKTLQSMCKSIVGMANINAKEFQKIKIAKPPVELQEKFAIRVAVIRTKVADVKQQEAEYNLLFNALMQKAFKGELNL